MSNHNDKLIDVSAHRREQMKIFKIESLCGGRCGIGSRGGKRKEIQNKSINQASIKKIMSVRRGRLRHNTPAEAQGLTGHEIGHKVLASEKLENK